MSVKFLSPEWAATVQDALNAHAGFKSAIANADLGLQFNINGSPDGDSSYYLKTSGGSAVLAIGTLEGADVTIGQAYDTARGIFSGDLNTQTAFMTGKLKVTGNLAKLMMHQGSIMQMQAALKGLDVEY
jgi:putative sterol carrier protein